MELGIGQFVTIFVSLVFVNNFVFSKFLGICPFIGVSKRLDSAIGMGMAVVFVMTMAGLVTALLQGFVLEHFHITYLQTIVFILVIAALVQMVEIVIQKVSPPLYQALGIYLPLITTNCAVLGVCIFSSDKKYGILGTAVAGFSAGIGFTIALLIMSGIRERLEFAKVPRALRGLPIAFIIAGLLSIAFLGFAGMIQE